jgi:hypothetical protein
VLKLGSSKNTFERVIIKEELSGGQRVLAFEVLADGVSVFSGKSVGSTMIALLEKNITATTVELKVTAARAPPSFQLFAIPDPSACYVSPESGGCNVLTNTQYDGLTIKSGVVSDIKGCCAFCKSNPSCAFFVAKQQSSWPYKYGCSLLSAMQHSVPMPGVTSGSPE